MKVFVYRNLHKKCLSVRNTKTGKVVAYVDSITLSDCKFKVSEKGRQRVLDKRQKNVHAGVQGIWLHDEAITKTTKRIIYNPYKYATFVEEDTLRPCYYSDTCVVTVEGVFIPT